MAGHSKWANIKHKKARTDKKRSKEFTKLLREIVVATRLGGPVSADNPRLRTAVHKALAANIAKDTVERAIKKGSGGDDGAVFEEITYEGYGPGGVAFMVDMATDNRNRTAAAVRNAFSKHDGNLGSDGSVAYLFRKKGQIIFTSDESEEKLLEVSIEAGAEDMHVHEDRLIEVLTEPQDLFAVKDALEASGYADVEASLAMLPETTVELDANAASKTAELIEALEELDDVREVFTNASFPDDFE